MRIKSEFRYELKYLLTHDQQMAILEELGGQMEPDPHGDEQGYYPIISLYFDTPDLKAYWDKLEGHRNRRKVRVRVYGDQTVTPETRCFLEIKQRVNKMLRKKRVELTYADAVAFEDFERELPELPGEARAVLGEVSYLYRTLQLRPACVVSYNRLAFNGAGRYPDLRVTFDADLRCRAHDLTLLSTGYAANHFVLAPQMCVMEIKVNQNVPYWLTQLVNKFGCTPRRISKYCAALEKCQLINARQRVMY